MMENNDKKYWLGLSKIHGLGPQRFKKLYSYFDSMESAWTADFNEFKLAGLEESVARNIIEERKDINLDREIEKLIREKIELVTVLDKEYPQLLSEIYDPPAILYYKGNLESTGDEFAISAVGTRKYSSYGKQITEKIIGELASQEITIVSGLALGIDALVHETTLTHGGRTIAVLGSGLFRENIYPSKNRYLADRICGNNGLLVSEYPPETLPLKGHFPQRNRIIAGLSVATLVLEAPERSGALITAKHALEFNRDVLAVPGNINSINASGTNNLIKLGAKLITSAADVLEVLDLSQIKDFVSNRKIVADSKEEEILLEFLSNEPIHINELIKSSSLDTAMVNSTLVLMEMRGKVKNLGNQMYILAR